MTALNSEQLTLIQAENHTAQPKAEPMFLHKFCQFYPFIQKLFYDNNWGEMAINTDCEAVTMPTF